MVSWGGSVVGTSMALLHAGSQRSWLMEVPPFLTCDFQGCPKNSHPASKGRKREVKQYLWGRPESEELTLPIFHWPELVIWPHLAAREARKCSFWLSIPISAILWKGSVNFHWYHICTRDLVCFPPAPYTYQPISYNSSIQWALLLAILHNRSPK